MPGLGSLISFGGCVVVLAFGGPVSAGPILVNGSFELGPPLVSEDRDVSAGSTEIPGWTVFGQSIDYLGSPWQVDDGLHALDLDGRGAILSGVEQTFLTTPGVTYVVSFAMSGNPAGGEPVKQLQARVADLALLFSFDMTGVSRTNQQWQAFVFSFQATQMSSTLAFQSLSTLPSSYGPLLDDVAVTAVPEPSTFTLLGGGVLALVRLRSRQREPERTRTARHD